MTGIRIFTRHLEGYIETRYPAGLSWCDASRDEDFIRTVSLCLDFLAVTQGQVGRPMDEYSLFNKTIMPIAAVLEEIDEGSGRAMDLDQLWHQLSQRFSVFRLGACPALAYCPQFDDPKNTLIATVTLQEVTEHQTGHRSGTYRYLAQANGSAAVSRLDVASQFVQNAFAPNAQMPVLRPLDVKRKAARQSEVAEILEQIAERVRKPGVSRLPPGVRDAITGLMRCTEGFSCFSNAAMGALASGVSYTSGLTDLYGGKVLILIGVSDDEIVYLMAEFDQWAE